MQAAIGLTGYEVTATGQQMAATAERMEDEVLTLDSNILGRIGGCPAGCA